MKTIANNKFYTLEVDPIKNRAFLKINGFWKLNDVPNYLDDWDKTISFLRKGFTLLTDAREMAIHPSEVRAIHEKAQNKIIEAGVKKVAELQKAKVAEMQLDGVSKDTKMPKMNFNEKEKALEWLAN